MVQSTWSVAKSPRVAEQCDVNLHSHSSAHPSTERQLPRTDLYIFVTRSPSSSGSIQCSITNVSGVRKFSHTPTLTVYLYFRDTVRNAKELTEDVCPIRPSKHKTRKEFVSTFDEIAQQGYSVDDNRTMPDKYSESSKLGSQSTSKRSTLVTLYFTGKPHPTKDV
ncbi:hypothetical protein TNCV_2755641 [Trichonephila clavipes]|nr:hypothetical protein TNCV_2755641 [Trichonephila clavipes]